MKTGYALAVLSLALVVPATADVITLSDGSKQMGLITENQPDAPTVKLRSSSGEIAIPRRKIARIDQEPKARSLMEIGDQFMAAGKAPEAMEQYKQSAALDKQNAEIAGKMRQAEAALGKQQELQTQKAASQTEEGMKKAVALAQQKKFDEAADLLKKLEPAANSPKLDDYRRLCSEFYTMWGTDRADHQDSAGAVEKFQVALRFAPDNDVAREQLTKVFDGDPTKLNEIANYYKDATKPEDRLKLAEALFKLKHYDLALPIYLELTTDPANSNQVTQDRIRLMFDMLHRQYATQGDYQKALATYQKFLEYSPKEDPTPIARYEYMIQASKTDQANPDARAALAKYAEERGLVSTAKKEYATILQAYPNNAAAKAGLMRYATAEMQEAVQLFTETQYLLAISKAQEVARDYAQFPEIVKQADELQTKASVEQQKVAKNKQEQATALAQRGDDYYNQALSYISYYTSSDRDTSKRVFSPKTEAIKYLQRALMAWKQALQIDPSLGAPTSYDLNSKIADATGKYAVLTNPNPPRLPFRDLNRSSRSDGSATGGL
ncbi:MAG: hypothetical protein K1X53_14765 [Candidatus Sumerlaeaceae bacterium]|nr:hypothetical protein [Candidatus Sumerlaeaceae bacterium]